MWGCKIGGYRRISVDKRGYRASGRWKLLFRVQGLGCSLHGALKTAQGMSQAIYP